jgi:peptidyl-prolyl cis-trans isomerase SurA
MCPCHARLRSLRTGLAIGLAAALIATGSAVLAQQQLPGLIVTVPPSDRAAPPPPAAAPEPPKAKAKPKPKPEQKAEKKRPSATASADGDAGPAISGPPGGARAVIMVNGEAITSYEIEQRARLLALQADVGHRAQENMKRMATSEAINSRWRQIVDDTVKSNPGKSRDEIMKILESRRAEFGASLQKQAVESAKASVMPGMREAARKELIEEVIKLQEAQRVGAKAEENEVENVVNTLAQNNKMTKAQLEKHFNGMGIDLATLRAKFRTNLAWAEVIRRKYSYLANPNQRDIDKLVAGAQGGEDDVELQLQRIVISVPAKIDQKVIAQRFAEAETLRSAFKDCRSMVGLTGKVQGARFETIGTRRPANFQEPTRTLLSNAQVGEMLPPNVMSQGIELLAVCDRKLVKADDKRRAEAAAELRQKEFEIQAKRLLRDLQQDAIIENVGQ